MSEPILSVRNLDKRFGSKVVALDDVSLDVYPGEIFALLGPSGCGKSTLLRMIAGFETPTAGSITLDGEDITRIPPNKRPINMVFQSYAVFPHMSVRDNIAYGLKMEKIPAQEISQRVETALQQVHLHEQADRKPEQLSGGQRQRVALARALVKQPRLLLLDEPLSALDAKLRDAMRLELVRLQSEVNVTFIMVTHDQSEALAMADRIAVLDRGRLRQLAPPDALYERPVDAFVADFIGNIHAFSLTRVDYDVGVVQVEQPLLGNFSWHLPELPAGISLGEQGEQAAVLAVRPEHIRLRLASETADPALSGEGIFVEKDQIFLGGTLGDIAFQGHHSIVEVHLTEGRAVTALVDVTSARHLLKAGLGAAVEMNWRLQDMLLLPYDSSAQATSAPTSKPA